MVRRTPPCTRSSKHSSVVIGRWRRGILASPLIYSTVVLYQYGTVPYVVPYHTILYTATALHWHLPVPTTYHTIRRGHAWGSDPTPATHATKYAHMYGAVLRTVLYHVYHFYHIQAAWARPHRSARPRRSRPEGRRQEARQANPGHLATMWYVVIPHTVLRNLPACADFGRSLGVSDVRRYVVCGR